MSPRRNGEEKGKKSDCIKYVQIISNKYPIVSLSFYLFSMKKLFILSIFVCSFLLSGEVTFGQSILDLSMSKEQACQTQSWENISVKWPWKIAYWQSFIRVDNTLYYSVLLAPDGKYDLNTGNHTANFFWSYIDGMYLYSYDCKTKEVKQLSYNLKNVSTNSKTSFAGIMWKKGNILALSIGQEWTDAISPQIFSLREKKLIDIYSFKWRSALQYFYNAFTMKYINDSTLETLGNGPESDSPEFKCRIDLKKRTITRIS